MPDTEARQGLVDGVLTAHDFEEMTRETAGDLTVLTGTMHRTLPWQSPAFGEYG